MTMPVTHSGGPKNLTSSGAISTGPCHLVGFYVNNQSGGTITLKDGGSSGTAVSGTITPASGWHAYPAIFGASAYAALSGTIDVTFFITASN